MPPAIKKRHRLPVPLLLSFLLLATATAASEDKRPAKDNPPDLQVGIATGYAHHFGKTVQVDAASGATSKLDDKKLNEPGGASGVFFDAGLLPLGKGELGLTAGFYMSYPKLFYDFAVIPRYKLIFRPHSRLVGTVSPWLGIPVFFTFVEELDEDLHFMFGLSVGCDISLGSSPWILGLAIHANFINPTAVDDRTIHEGQEVKTEQHLDSVFGLVSIGYKFL